MQRKTLRLMLSAFIIVLLLGIMLKNILNKEEVSSAMVDLADGTTQLDFTSPLTKLDQSITTFEAYKGKI
ncbi:hypothetical protein MHB44_11720 [Lysinibacillus sp. FSL H8-0500]|uniref:hypothetical protein n=1 Tax=Lysinibacillus sp. FSL H8-0500 TaxID=2921393 RepID=UPI0031010B1F